MAKVDPAAVRENMAAYLADLVRTGKVTMPKDGHSLLKKKFGRSLTFGEVSRIVGANRQGGPAPTQTNATTRKKRRRGKPRRPRKADRGPARVTRSRAPSRKARNGIAAVDYVILGRNREPILARGRNQAVDGISTLLAAGANPAEVALFQRIAFDVEYMIDS